MNLKTLALQCNNNLAGCKKVTSDKGKQVVKSHVSTGVLPQLLELS